jgi:hypothetical protein
MGIDFLDLSFELEKQFGVPLEPADLIDIWRTQGNDCTAGQLHEIMCDKCCRICLPVPRSSWNRVRIALVKTLGVSVREVTPGAWLRRDLDFD